MTQTKPGSLHRHPHPGLAYPTRFRHRLYGLVIAPLLVAAVAAALVHIFAPNVHPETSLLQTVLGLGASVLRLVAAYVFALLIAIPLALLTAASPKTEHVLLPFFGALQAVPVLALFPIVILVCVQHELSEVAAVIIISAAMVWNLVFSIAGGVREIPAAVTHMTHVFGMSRLEYFRRVALPASLPYAVSGSIMAWSMGWNILIVAEVLHTYLPNGAPSQDVFGVGSLMVHALAAGNATGFITGLVGMVMVIAAMNFFVWQKLLFVSERYRFE